MTYLFRSDRKATQFGKMSTNSTFKKIQKVQSILHFFIYSILILELPVFSSKVVLMFGPCHPNDTACQSLSSISMKEASCITAKTQVIFLGTDHHRPAKN